MNRKEIEEILKRYENRMNASISYFHKSMEEMKKASDEFASEISEHIIDLDERLSKIERSK